MASIKDVAKLAKVAPSTVSLVLNQKGYVSEISRKKVEAAMQELSYIPSEMARNLSLSRTNIIGIIVPEISHPFFGTFIHAVEAELYGLGYKTMVCSTVQKANAEQDFVDMLRRRTMDGIIMGAHSLELDIYRNINRPIVAFDRFINDEIPIIHADHQNGGRIAAKAFLKHECHHIVQIIGARKVSSPANKHHEVFKQILCESGIVVDTIEMAWNAFEPIDFSKIVENLFTEYPDVDGILGPDLAICSCLRLAEHYGRNVPADLRLVAYDGTYVTRMGSRTITAVVQPISLLAHFAAEKMIALIRGELGEKLQALPVSLQQGDTC
ncbi:MAG: transcriptional regulator, LacI family [Sporomusa sp.]|nr:transcriptional regulator, LacI family [Sporomusa sp.]